VRVKELKTNSTTANRKRTLKDMGKIVVKKNAIENVSKQLMVVKNIAKLLNEKDHFGRTALHLAADINR